jgi:ubiquinone/menaquinone biosynthesis C-methylase UbiE
MGDTYTHGHHESVLRSHTWRTVENSAAYLIDELQPGRSLLDVGCGPGTITLDFAARLAPGVVTGIDASADVVDQAAATATERNVANVAFETGDVYDLRFDDEVFDIVHAHQVLQHLTDPVAALVEMRRVVRPGGVVGVRDSDYATFTWAPDDPVLDRWLALYHEVTERNGAEADAGRYLLGWTQRAGFTDLAATSSTWTFADPDTRAWWGCLWADRAVHSSFAEQALEYGLSEPAELEAIAGAWRRWADQPDGWMVILHAEILARP